MRLGVLDVGSNTVHLVVVDAHRGAHPTPMHDDRWVLKLAEHVGEDGRLSTAGEKALLTAVQQAKRQAADRRCDELLAFVTSAIREADNGAAVLRRVREQTGVDLQVLTGEDEARLTFLAVRRWFGWGAGRLLVMGIGGGFLEVGRGGGEGPGGGESGAPGHGRRFTGAGGRGGGGPGGGDLGAAGRRPDAPPLPPRGRDRGATGPRGAGRAGRPRRRGARPGGGQAARGRPSGSGGRHLQDLPHDRPAGRGRALRRRSAGAARAYRHRAGPGAGLRGPDRVRRAGRAAGGLTAAGAPGPGRCRRGAGRDGGRGRTVCPYLSVGAA